LQKSSGTAAVNSLETVATVASDRDGNAISSDRSLAGECSGAQTSEIPAAYQMRSPTSYSTDELDSEDTNCIPDTQFVPSSHHLACLPATASSPDVEMIPDTPDNNASDIHVPKTFQRSYLASRSNLFATCNGRQQKKTSPLQRKTTKVRSRLRKHISLSTNTVQDCASVSHAGDAISVTDISPNILHWAFASQLPYPSCDGLNKRCATDPLPLSKRSDHKVTPTKPVSLTNYDTVYGTLPSRLFQEALTREKCQVSAPTKNKENLRPSVAVEEICESSVLDSDPVLLEVLGELKVESPKHESARNVTVARSSPAVDKDVFDDVISHCSKSADRHVETVGRDDDLEDILGELRQHLAANDTDKNGVQRTPSSLSALTLCSDSVNVVDDGSSVRSNKSRPTECSDVRDVTFTDSKSEQTNDSTSDSMDGCSRNMCSDAVDVKTVDESSESYVQSVFDDISDSKLLSEMSFSATCDKDVRYISDFILH